VLTKYYDKISDNQSGITLYNMIPVFSLLYSSKSFRWLYTLRQSLFKISIKLWLLILTLGNYTTFWLIIIELIL